MSEWNKIKIEIQHEIEKKPVPIVSNAVAGKSNFADGRMIPVLIIDTSNRKDIEDMICAHKIEGRGDVESTWVKPSDVSKFRLWLTVTKPSRCLILLEFDLVSYGVLVEQIIQAQGLYLQPGRPGDRFSKTMDHDRILVEVPSRDFRDEWDRIWKKALFKDFRERGVPRGKAKEAADHLINQWRQFSSMRLR
jgi:hypothetical protein